MARSGDKLHNRPAGQCLTRGNGHRPTRACITVEDEGVIDLAGFPAWYWQVLGALLGLALGVLLGAIRSRRRHSASTPPASARNAAEAAPGPRNGSDTGAERPSLPRVMVPPPPAPKPAVRTEVNSSPQPRRKSSAAGAPATKPPLPPAPPPAAPPTTPVSGRSGTPSPTAASTAPAPVVPPGQAAGTTPVSASSPASTAAASSSGTGSSAATRPSAPSAPAVPTEPPPAGAPDAVAVLQEYNAELLEQLRALQVSHAQEQQERQQLVLTERRRHESQVEALRQEHSTELGRLMSTMAEQVDTLHLQYGQRLKELEAEMDRLRVGAALNAPSTMAAPLAPTEPTSAPAART